MKEYEHKTTNNAQFDTMTNVAPHKLKVLCKYAPSAYVVPVTINNSWKMTRWGSFPFGIGNKIILTIHYPIPVKDMSFSEIFAKTEQTIVRVILPVDLKKNNASAIIHKKNVSLQTDCKSIL
jgi:hypothetical protein